MKKWMCAVVFLAIVTGNAFANSFDVEYISIKDEIEAENSIKREDFFAMIGSISGKNAGDELNYIFEDDDEIEPRYKKYVYSLANDKIISGENANDKFYLQPKREITRLEVAVIITKALGIYSTSPCEFADTDIPAWANDYIYTAVNFGIMNLDSNRYFNAKATVTLEEASEMLEEVVGKGYFEENKTTIYAGNGISSLNDGELSDSSFFAPTGIIKYKDAIYVADTKNNSIREIKENIVSTVAGNSDARDEFEVAIGSFADGNKAKFDAPSFLATPKTGLLISDTNNNLIRYFIRGKVSTYAGNVNGGYKDGKRTKALFNNPTGIVATSKGIVYIADTGNNVIRKIDRNDNVTTYAGVVSSEGGYKDGNAREAMFNRPMGLVLKGDVLYVADCGNQRIRKIENGKVSTIAGVGDEKYDDSNEIIGDYIDGTTENARFNFPQNIAIDEEGNIYVADTGNSAIRKIDKDGNVYTIAGLSKNDEVEIVSPVGLMIDENKLYVTDTVKNNIIVIDIEEAK